MNEVLIVRQGDSILELKLNRPEKRNAIDRNLLAALVQELERAGDDTSIRVVIISAVGESFCAGADITSRNQHGEREPIDIDEVNGLVDAMVRLPHPIIAVLEGPAAGIGVALALAADVIVMTETAYMRPAFGRLGLMPDGGLTALLAASAGRHAALELALLGGDVLAAEAYRLGLATRVVSSESIGLEVEKIADALIVLPAETAALTKRAVNEAALGELERAFQRERRGQRRLRSSDEFDLRIRAFETRRHRG